MGYTHYFTQKRDLTPDEWKAIKGGAQIVISRCGVPLAWEYDQPKRAPEISARAVRFNGVGEEDGHETFYLTRKRPGREAWQDEAGHGFQFCKTARKPYDRAVVGLLAVLATVAPDAFDLGSDGGEEALAEGRKLLAEWSQ